MSGVIGVDWGSSNLRAFRFDDQGTVKDRRSSAHGAAGLAKEDFPRVLAEVIGDWCDGGTRIVMAGMVGGRVGWQEAPYLPCPADPGQLAASALPLETSLGRAWLVPGLSSRNADGMADVMRGEETQLLGAGVGNGSVVLPGTHSKWATMQDGRIMGFSTAMTGELYALLCKHSLLGQLAVAAADFEPEAFKRGTRRALDARTIVPLLFSARADVLLGDMQGTAVESYLSGLLIGGEIAAFGAQPVTLIGNTALVERYQLALHLAGAPQSLVVDGDCAVARGLWMIGEHL
ncbi:2-dehydro-3-deoxygalactonokinase [Sphingobium boeckii]|uniref:2-dehydro-3-deoxygalactonokinase n=1 Tax=Sphingobium boeckii TaxID=1082345 RepID=A0A7W9EDJ9_9SPHN|nr:2-dehydro-3-deoxygalactonokinase [Sphingobium boeckii]MBB5685368.1 2-dehydro-3-deoxygalactonokinase [Sphingobium boeckii]